MGLLPCILAFIGGISLLPAVLSLSFGFPYGAQKVRGVNLGGWLLLEVLGIVCYNFLHGR